jgi:hypothetical protein
VKALALLHAFVPRWGITVSRKVNSVIGIVVSSCGLLLAADPVVAQLFIPDKLFSAVGVRQTMTDSVINQQMFSSITPIPDPFIFEETNLNGTSPPSGEPGGVFEGNEYIFRFAKVGEAGTQNSGHFFLRRSAFDIAFNMKIESPNQAPRKEAGIYFQSSSLGNSMFIATSNDTFYGSGRGSITSIYNDILPQFNFSGGGGPVGDYNGNGTLDAADYIVWRDTLGSTTDFRANGNNEGDSMNLIDQADYDVWQAAFGNGSATDLEHYDLGDDLRIRLIYTPPVVANPALPDSGVADDPNITAPATIEYKIRKNNGTEFSSGALPFTNTWKGLANDTRVMLRVQNLGTAAVDNDSSKVTFSNFDFNGDAPGTGLGSSSGSVVPEPGTASLLAVFVAAWAARRRRRSV